MNRLYAFLVLLALPALCGNGFELKAQVGMLPTALTNTVWVFGNANNTAIDTSGNWTNQFSSIGGVTGQATAEAVHGPTNFQNWNQVYLQFFHHYQSQVNTPVPTTPGVIAIMISSDSINFDTVYQSTQQIWPPQFESIDISAYAANEPQVWLKMGWDVVGPSIWRIGGGQYASSEGGDKEFDLSMTDVFESGFRHAFCGPKWMTCLVPGATDTIDVSLISWSTCDFDSIELSLEVFDREADLVSTSEVVGAEVCNMGCFSVPYPIPHLNSWDSLSGIPPDTGRFQVRTTLSPPAQIVSGKGYVRLRAVGKKICISGTDTLIVNNFEVRDSFPMYLGCCNHDSVYYTQTQEVEQFTGASGIIVAGDTTGGSPSQPVRVLDEFVVFKAEQGVTLKPGFHAIAGDCSGFLAYPEACPEDPSGSFSPPDEDYVSSGMLLPDKEENPVRFYPNPVNEILHIRFKADARTELGLHLYDMMGRRVVPPLYQTTQNSGYHHLRLDLSALSSGLYHCVLDKGRHQESGLILKE